MFDCNINCFQPTIGILNTQFILETIDIVTGKVDQDFHI